MASVRLDNLRKVYPDGHVAVAGVSLEIADGERIVLVGPSGCGKTSLLRMIAGLESISAGSVSIDGRVVNDVAPKDRDVAMVFQNFALYPHMTVAQNLGFGLRLRGVGRAEVARRVAEVAVLLDLAERLDARPAALSGGQRQRVALGRALLREPKVFLLDEPLSSLDARLRQAMRAQILALHRRLGTTMIYVTHDQTEAMTLGQRIVVLDRGVVQQIDTPMALYERPANLFVAGFFGHPGMNLLPGELGADGSLSLRGDAGAVALPPPLAAGCGPRGRKLVLGLRPEHLRPDPHGSLQARVAWSEPLGNETLLHLMLGDTPLVARLPPGVAFTPDTVLGLGFDPAQAQLFDPASGARLGAAPVGSSTGGPSTLAPSHAAWG